MHFPLENKRPPSEPAMLEHLRAHLQGKVIALGIGNSLHSDDGFGSLLAAGIKERLGFPVFDAGPTPENYLGRVIREAPDTVLLMDAVDFGGEPGEVRVLEDDEFRAVNFLSTHNLSISMSINYLQGNIKTDIIILAVQPKSLAFGDTLSPQVKDALERLTRWFCGLDEKKG